MKKAVVGAVSAVLLFAMGMSIVACNVNGKNKGAKVAADKFVCVFARSRDVDIHMGRLLSEAAKAVVTLSTASPFKFPGAVLEAAGVMPSGDEFAQMEALSRMSGLPIPKGLSGLKEKPVRFTDVIGGSAIEDYVMEVIRKGEV